MRSTLGCISKSARALGVPLMTAALALAVVTGALASLSAWRNPDADIREFFGGGDYRTVLVTVGDKKGKIEQRIGTSLDSDETQLRFWPVTKDGQRVGTVASHRGRVDCCSGPIEVVIAIADPADGPAKIKAVKIQQDGGQYGSALRDPKFLNQFRGKQAASKLKVGDDIKSASPGAVRASELVALSCKKALVAYEELGIANR